MAIFTGTDGADTLVGSFFSDVLNGLDGDDVIAPRPGHDRIDGGDGFDTVDYSPIPIGATVDLSVAGPQIITFDKVDTLISIEGILSGNSADVLRGAAGPNAIFGGGGDDRISDPGGSNYLRGEAGDDSITGGSDFDDINGNMGADTCSGGDGDDWVVGGKDNDSLSGDAGSDIVYGNIGADTCEGGAGNDIVRGGQDNDIVRGGAGGDFVSGDRGDDTVSGGAGADLFHTFGEAGLDVVTDFSIAEGDRVMLDPGTQYAVSQIGADTVIDMIGGGRMILQDVQMSSLPDGWIFGA